jgi:nitrogenase iron protein NifH
MAQVRQIALYGKGGCGKSTVASNLAVCFQEMGKKVMQMGLSPKTDSTVFLLEGKPQTQNILEYARTVGVDAANIYDVIVQGTQGIWCAEAGGPAPAEGCAGRGAALALELLTRYDVFSELGVDLVIYDVIADVVCGGFSMPMRGGYAEEVYLVTSGELMALYSANNICSAIADLAHAGVPVRVGGIINNQRGVGKETELVEEFGKKINVPVIGHIPRSDTVQKCESMGGTVVEKASKSPQAQYYRDIAKAILSRTPEDATIPTPIELADIMALLRKYQALD